MKSTICRAARLRGPAEKSQRARRAIARELATGIILSSIALGCAAGSARTTHELEPEAPPSAESRAPSAAPEADQAFESPKGEIGLRQALAAALVGNPKLQVFSSEIPARDARALQAGLFPNPELRVEIENVGGGGDRETFETAETTFLLSQLFEIGGQRGRRQHAADLDVELARFDYEAARLELQSDVMRAFFTTLAAQERLALAEEVARVSDESVSVVDERIRAGAAAPVEATRARVVAERARASRARAERDLAAARSGLAATWGASSAEFTRVRGDLSVLAPIPPRQELLARLEENPDLARWTTEHEERLAELSLEESNAIPNARLGAGGRHFSDNGDNALVFEVSMPLPVLDRNQGRIEEARLRVERARSERRAAEVSARSALEVAYEEASEARELAESLAAHVLPEAKMALEGAREAYRKGFFGSIDVLEAQRTLFEMRAEYVKALEEAHMAAAELGRLVAAPLLVAAEGEPR